MNTDAAQQEAHRRFVRSLGNASSDLDRAHQILGSVRELDRRIERRLEAARTAPSELDRRRQLARAELLEEEQVRLLGLLDDYPAVFLSTLNY